MQIMYHQNFSSLTFEKPSHLVSNGCYVYDGQQLYSIRPIIIKIVDVRLNFVEN